MINISYIEDLDYGAQPRSRLLLTSSSEKELEVFMALGLMRMLGRHGMRSYNHQQLVAMEEKQDFGCGILVPQGYTIDQALQIIFDTAKEYSFQVMISPSFIREFRQAKEKRERAEQTRQASLRAALATVDDLTNAQYEINQFRDSRQVEELINKNMYRQGSALFQPFYSSEQEAKPCVAISATASSAATTKSSPEHSQASSPHQPVLVSLRKIAELENVVLPLRSELDRLEKEKKNHPRTNRYDARIDAFSAALREINLALTRCKNDLKPESFSSCCYKVYDVLSELQNNPAIERYKLYERMLLTMMNGLLFVCTGVIPGLIKYALTGSLFFNIRGASKDAAQKAVRNISEIGPHR